MPQPGSLSAAWEEAVEALAAVARARLADPAVARIVAELATGTDANTRRQQRLAEAREELADTRITIDLGDL